tara:strand:+ start:334 stop:576 length:243 start_codon:yes stop_codon:yes gene_type:complete
LINDTRFLVLQQFSCPISLDNVLSSLLSLLSLLSLFSLSPLSLFVLDLGFGFRIWISDLDFGFGFLICISDLDLGFRFRI